MKRKMSQHKSMHSDAASREFEHRSVAFTGVVPDVPLAVVEEILLNLPAHQVLRVCRLVCRDWKELVDSAAHWRERFRREGIQPCDASRPQNTDGLQAWKIIESGGDGWETEKNRKPFPDHTVVKCFVTSSGLCMKQQLIDLMKEGYNAAFVDQLQPHIRISDWYAPCRDCGCQYNICLELLDQEMKCISIFQPRMVVFEWPNDELWCEMTHVFKDYGPGVRFIRFTHGGKDTRYWAGHYGVRITNSCVEICPAESC